MRRAPSFSAELERLNLEKKRAIEAPRISTLPLGKLLRKIDKGNKGGRPRKNRVAKLPSFNAELERLNLRSRPHRGAHLDAAAQD